MTLTDATAPLSADFRAAIGTRLDSFLAARTPELAAIGPELAELERLAADFTSGGKRLRPAFCWWDWAAVRPLPDDPAPLLDAAASLDLLHVSALVHDDVMDDSATRRGRAAAHVQLAAAHAARAGRGDAVTFGRAGAILLGDLLVMWSAELFDGCGLSGVDAARPLLARMRTEVTCGQYLDVVSQTRSPKAGTLDDVSRVVEYKSARYTVVRPAQLGAALAGGGPAELAALAAFGSPLGRAFQYRDDVLGVFGDPAVTGKPAGDDLREGKRTVLIAHAFAGTDGPDRLEALLGRPLSPAEVEEARGLITASGARDRVEADIDALLAEALAALEAAPIREEGRTALAALARLAVDREA